MAKQSSLELGELRHTITDAGTRRDEVLSSLACRLEFMIAYLWAQTGRFQLPLQNPQTLPRVAAPLQKCMGCCKAATSTGWRHVMSEMFQTLEFDEDSQAKFTVLFGWTAQNGFKMHVCNPDCIIWIRQSSRELRGCGKRSWLGENFTGGTSCLQCWVTVGTCAHAAVNQTLKKEGKVVDGTKTVTNQWKHNRYNCCITIPLHCWPLQLVKRPCMQMSQQLFQFQSHLYTHGVTSPSRDSIINMREALRNNI